MNVNDLTIEVKDFLMSNFKPISKTQIKSMMYLEDITPLDTETIKYWERMESGPYVCFLGADSCDNPLKLTGHQGYALTEDGVRLRFDILENQGI